MLSLRAAKPRPDPSTKSLLWSVANAALSLKLIPIFADCADLSGANRNVADAVLSLKLILFFAGCAEFSEAKRLDASCRWTPKASDRMAVTRSARRSSQQLGVAVTRPRQRYKRVVPREQRGAFLRRRPTQQQARLTAPRSQSDDSPSASGNR